MIHTPAQSSLFMVMINGLTNVQFTDSSYGNDLCDSIYNEGLQLQLFLPNVTNPFSGMLDGEDHLDFGMCFDTEDGQLYVDHEFTLLELIATINSFGNLLKGDDWEDYMMDFIKANYQDWNTISKVLALEVGDDVNCGGGASGDSWVERIK